MSRLSVTVTMLVPLIFTSSLMVGHLAAPACASAPARPTGVAELLEDSVRGLLRQAPLPTGSMIARYPPAEPG